MGDFHQPGLIGTLQNLNPAHGEALESRLRRDVAARPVSLVLPCHFSDVGSPVLAEIVRELCQATFLSEVIISANGLDAAGSAAAKDFFRALRLPHRIIWNDSPELRRVYGELPRIRAPSRPGGKGFNVWGAIGLVLAEAKSEVIVVHDCDIGSYDRSMVARLCSACVHSDLDYNFAKIYYSRFSDRIYGRVSRLFLTPLLQALVRVLGHQPLLDFLLSFRYPLAGEFAIRRPLAGGIRVLSGWALEIGMLCDVFRTVDPRTVCQVDGGVDYHHRHQLVGDRGSGLVRMSREIAAALLSRLAEEGLVLDAALLRAMLSNYLREAADAQERYRKLAVINGIEYDAETEQGITHSFAAALGDLAQETPESWQVLTLPSWDELRATEPRWVDEFCAAIEAES